MLYLPMAMLETHEDQQKMAELYLHYREYLLKIAHSILRNHDDAEDVLHHAFERIAQDFNKIGDITSHQTRNFLVIIVRGLALNLYNERRKVVELPFDDLEKAGHSIAAKDRTLDLLDYAILREILEELPLIHRDVLYLMYYEELSVREIAGLLSLTEHAVKKRLERARHALQKNISMEIVMA